SCVSALTSCCSPRKGSLLPADRAEARRVSFPTGNCRLSRVSNISAPTAPVAPTIATWGVRFIEPAIIPFATPLSKPGGMLGQDGLEFLHQRILVFPGVAASEEPFQPFIEE